MAQIDNAADAKRLRDAVKTEKTRVPEFRRLRDRQADSVLDSLKVSVPESYKTSWMPYQSGELDDEIHIRNAILASNPGQLEVVAMSQAAAKKAQELENADRAMLDSLFDIEFDMMECDSINEAGYFVFAIDCVDDQPNLAKYADRPELESSAENADEPDEGDDSPQANYTRAYRAKGDHEEAYKAVTAEARRMDPFPRAARPIDVLTFDCFVDDRDRVVLGVECGRVALNPLLKALASEGMELVGNKFVVTDSKKPTDMPALAGAISPVDSTNDWGLDLGVAQQTVMYTQIRTLEQTMIMLEHLDGQDDAQGMPGGFVSWPNRYGGKATGYYIVSGNKKMRATFEERYNPPTLGLMVEQQGINFFGTLIRTMALEEATRDKTQVTPTARVVPALDGGQEPRVKTVKDGQVIPAGQVVRTETTGIDVAAAYEMADKAADRYRTKEFFSGAGSTDETGIHLARLQTAFLTKLVPTQTRRAAARKQVLIDEHVAIIKSQQSLVVPWIPKGARQGDSVRVAQPYEITPELAALPVKIVYTIGAESPETKYAAQQAGRAEVDFGSRALLTHMENSGVNDPEDEMARIFESNLIRGALGNAQGEGWAVAQFRELTMKRFQAWLDAQFPPPPPPPIDPMTGLPVDAAMMDEGPEMAGADMAGPGPVPPGVTQLPPPVQNIDGVPVSAGAQAVSA